MIERIVSKLVESNVFVVSKGKYCFIVDAGVTLDEVKKAVVNKKVEAIFLTHGHYDHSFYVEEYIKEFGCKVYCSEYAKEYLKSADYNCSEKYAHQTFVVKDFSKFFFLKNKGRVTLEHFDVEYHQLGGHSKSDMIYLFGDNVFVGDVLIGRDMGRTDLYGGDKVAMKNSLKFLRELEYKTMYSGHGEETPKQVQDKVANLWIKFLSR